MKTYTIKKLVWTRNIFNEEVASTLFGSYVIKNQPDADYLVIDPSRLVLGIKQAFCDAQKLAQEHFEGLLKQYLEEVE